MERLLLAIEQKITQMSQIPSTIKKGNPHIHEDYPVDWTWKKVLTAPKLPQDLQKRRTLIFTPIIFFLLWALPEAGLRLGRIFRWADTFLRYVFCILTLVSIIYIWGYATRMYARRAYDQLAEKNKAIDLQNSQIHFQNHIVVSKCAAAREELLPLQDQLAAIVNETGYPPDCVCLDAVRFFIHALQNDQADTFGQLLALYDSHDCRRLMRNGQQELNDLLSQQSFSQERMAQLLRYTNGLKAANLAALIVKQAEVRASNDATHIQTGNG